MTGVRPGPGPGSGPEGVPSAIALTPILSARYRSADPGRIRRPDGDRPPLPTGGGQARPGHDVGEVGPGESRRSRGEHAEVDVTVERDAADVDLEDLLATTQIGLVDDDPHVFATTLVENVRLARPSATDLEVDLALRQARLGDWLDGLPDGLDSWLGDGPAQVSGGERARIAIARSLLADQPVLVLDEPAAHLDGATAEALAAEVLSRGDGRTVVWITHADAGLDRVDRVLSLG